jgi:hypothetical protein
MEKGRERMEWLRYLGSLFRGQHVIGVWTRHFHHDNHHPSQQQSIHPRHHSTLNAHISRRLPSTAPNIPESSPSPSETETAFEKSSFLPHHIPYNSKESLSFIIYLSIYLSIRVAFSRFSKPPQNSNPRGSFGWLFYSVCYCAGSDLT